MSQSSEVKALEDDAIQMAAETSLGKYYRLGKKVTVRVSGNHRVCLTCVKNDCPHVRRVNDFLRDFPQPEIL